ATSASLARPHPSLRLPLLSFSSPPALRLHLHFFPTRRSSDLLALPAGVRLAPFRYTAATGQPLTAVARFGPDGVEGKLTPGPFRDRKSTRLNSSHQIISYAVFCLKKKKKTATTN